MTTDWIIGFIWGSGSIFSGSLRLRHYDKKLLSLVVKHLDLKTKPYRSKGGNFVLHISERHELTQTVLGLGWSGRKDRDRQYPIGDINQLEFIRGYCYTKASIHLRKNKDKKGKIYLYPRLAICGSEGIVREIDCYFISNLNTSPKKPYRFVSRNSGGECYMIYYSSTREVPKIIGLIDTNLFPGDPEREYPLHRMLNDLRTKHGCRG